MVRASQLNDASLLEVFHPLMNFAGIPAEYIAVINRRKYFYRSEWLPLAASGCIYSLLISGSNPLIQAVFDQMPQFGKNQLLAGQLAGVETARNAKHRRIFNDTGGGAR